MSSAERRGSVGSTSAAAVIIVGGLLLLVVVGGTVLTFLAVRVKRVAIQQEEMARVEAQFAARAQAQAVAQAKSAAAKNPSASGNDEPASRDSQPVNAMPPAESGQTKKVDAEQNTATEPAETAWRKHELATGWGNSLAVGADFTGDGVVDAISQGEGKIRLLVGPNGKQVILSETVGLDCIHGEVIDVDADGDPDFIGARYSPGLIFWLERPDDPLQNPWPYHLVDDQVDGIHGVLTGDVDRDGTLDLLANSAQPTGPFANSLVWYDIPDQPRQAASWNRHLFAAHDAPGLTHYLGFGDVNGDGRPDAATGAKGGPTAEPGSGDWFAWWEAPQDPTTPWTKHMIAQNQIGATNIHPADVNGDGRVDFVASCGHGLGVFWFEAPTWEQHAIDPKLNGAHCLQAADMDGDGDIDVATCAKDDLLAIWFENDGQGNFRPHVVAKDQSAYDIRAIDMDGDGDRDLLIGGLASKNVVWYENPGR